jgi:hypothetical protein
MGECDEGERLRAALDALVARDPIVRYGSVSYGCHYCDDESAVWAYRREQVEHAEDCPWVRARDALRRDAPGKD